MNNIHVHSPLPPPQGPPAPPPPQLPPPLETVHFTTNAELAAVLKTMPEGAKILLMIDDLPALACCEVLSPRTDHVWDGNKIRKCRSFLNAQAGATEPVNVFRLGWLDEAIHGELHAADAIFTAAEESKKVLTIAGRMEGRMPDGSFRLFFMSDLTEATE